MPLLKPNKSGLTYLRRLKAAVPLIVATATVAVYLHEVQHGRSFAIQAKPPKERNFVENMIFFGLDRIKAAGFELSWDQRSTPASPPPQADRPADRPGADPEMWKRIDEGLRRMDEEVKKHPK